MTSDRKMRDVTMTLRLDDIVPYWRNPRVITEEAVNAVAESIRRYGYQQPIVTDAQHVIIMGHTRYAACRRMGVTEVEVRVAASLSQAKVKQLRILDNRLHEYTMWDFDVLVEELDTLDASLMRGYFPDVVGDDPGVPGTAELTGSGRETVQEFQSDEVAFTCPSCFHEWSAVVTRDQVMSGRIEVPA